VKKFYVLGIRIFLVIFLLNQVTFINAEESQPTFESKSFEEEILACIRPLGSIRTLKEIISESISSLGDNFEKLKNMTLGNAACVNKTNTTKDWTFKPGELETEILVHCTAVQVRKHYGKEGYEYRDSYAFGSDENYTAVAYPEFESLEEAVNASKDMQCIPLIGVYDIPIISGQCRGLNGTNFLKCANREVILLWYDYHNCIDDVVLQGYNFLENNCCSGVRKCATQIRVNSTVIDELYNLNAGAGREVNFNLTKIFPHETARILDMSSTSSKISAGKAKRKGISFISWIKSFWTSDSKSSDPKNDKEDKPL
jgi:hypothetical protein